VSGLLILVTVLTSGTSAQNEQSAPVAPASPGTRLAIDVDRPSTLAAARALYEAADYQNALDMLSHLVAGKPPSRQDRQSIDLYRILSLVALGKRPEADEAMTDLITRDPLYRPGSEMPPRLRSVFADKRRLVLPSMIQSRYTQAKNAFDRSDYKAAAEAFSEVLAALSDPDIVEQASRLPLSDLRLLAVGFNDLAVRAITTPPVPPPPSTMPAPAPSAGAFRAPIYDSNHPEVSAPVTVQQDIPRFPRPLLTDRTGVLFIVIDESGGVESAIVTESVDRAYDQMLVARAKTWRYRPATLNGVAVKYRKRIQLTLPRQTN